MTFNEWMLHIRRELNYPKEILEKYEQSIASVPQDQRWTNKNRNRPKRGSSKDSRGSKTN